MRVLLVPLARACLASVYINLAVLCSKLKITYRWVFHNGNPALTLKSQNPISLTCQLLLIKL